MLSPFRLTRALAAALAVFSFGFTHAYAQPAHAVPPVPAFSDEPLVIAGGTLTHAGKSMPATVGNVVGLLRERYPEANITVLGVESLPIGDLTLNWKRHLARNDDGFPVWREPSLHGVLEAFRAASTFKFHIDSSDGLNFLLRATPVHDESSSVSVRTEVFNLSRLTSRSRPRSDIERELRQVERTLEVGAKRFAADHPNITQLVDRIAILKAELAENEKPTQDAVKKLVDQINEVVTLTLAAQNADEKPPAFQYHAGTNLLIATGSSASIQATKQVLAAMRENR